MPAWQGSAEQDKARAFRDAGGKLRRIVSERPGVCAHHTNRFPVVHKNIVYTPLDNPVPHGDNRYGEQLRSQRGAFAMLLRPGLLHNLIQFVCMLLPLLGDGVRHVCLCLRPSTSLAVENLILRQQLASYQERHVKPRRATHATRLTLT
jgi:hypothetical protein